MEQQIHFKNRSGENLAATLHSPAVKVDCGVVLGHCFTCSRHTGILRQLAADLNQAGFMALRFDFSGNGQSEGLFTESTYSKQIAEMSLAAEQLKARGAKWIGMAGHSMGALISMLTAAERSEIMAVAAIAGRLSGIQAIHFLSSQQRKQLSETGRVFFESRGRALELTDAFFADAEQFDPPRLLTALQTPLLVVHGDQDEIISVKEAYKAQEFNPRGVELVIVKGADHMFSREDQRKTASARIVAFFERQRNETGR